MIAHTYTVGTSIQSPVENLGTYNANYLSTHELDHPLRTEGLQETVLSFFLIYSLGELPEDLLPVYFLGGDLSEHR